MSRVGKKPIAIPAGVTITVAGRTVTIKGPLGDENLSLLDGIDVDIKDQELMVLASDVSNKQINAYHGLIRSLLSNIVIGVSLGFTKEIEIIGVGYRALQQNKDVQFQLGYSHPVIFSPPEGITIEVMEPTKLRIMGKNKQQVGQVAANIRELRPPEPYKGKGIRYKGERVRKKAGKTGK